MVHFLNRLFSFFTPSSVFGVELTDSVFRFIAVSDAHGSQQCFSPLQYGEVSLVRNVIQDGIVIDKQTAIHTIKQLKKQYGITRVRIALSAKTTYCFTVSLSKKIKNIQKSVESVIADYIPVAKNDAIINCVIVHSYSDMNIVRVVAVEKKVAQQYADLFVGSGIIPLHMETEVEAYCAAVFPKNHEGVSLLITAHDTYVVIALVYNGTAIYTRVVEGGGNALVAAVATKCVIAPNEAYVMVSEYGFAAPTEQEAVFGVLSDSVASVVKAIKEIVAEWNTQKVRKNIFPAIDSIVLAGEYSTIPGFSEYLSSQCLLVATVANPWERCVPCPGVVPALPYQDAVRYSGVIGAAMQGYIYE